MQARTLLQLQTKLRYVSHCAPPEELLQIEQNHCWWHLGRVVNWQNRQEERVITARLLCRLKVSWDVCSVCRLRKRGSVSPRSVNLLSQELSCVRPKRDSRENHIAKKEFLFWVIYIRSRLTCMVSKRSSACESPSVTVALGQL